MLIVSATDAVALKVDPAVVLATRKYVDDGVIEVKSFTDKQLKAHEAKANPHSQYLLIKNALKEIADAGLAGEVLENLGLKDIAVSLKYGAPLIGELVEWPHEKMPQEIWPDMSMEFIPYMAQSFDPVKYPLLSKLHPKNKLPADMRAQVARGWDNGRGIDTGRVLMSEQGDAVRNITGTVGNVQFRTGGESGTGAQSGVFKMEASTVAGNSSAGVDPARVVGIDISKQVPTAAENRVKSVAWNFIVRAK
ncbi:Phage tail fiber protein [Cronobacter condimenti 1330]|uniref:Phage tail fiber protein n=1 Tax=Cronobacter condimenti 1330 TaxID=1073999 RepID=K8ACJ0_9ENTR|nr:Phage tail fiber protein [Cronobacter condimenti 1330]